VQRVTSINMPHASSDEPPLAKAGATSPIKQVTVAAAAPALAVLRKSRREIGRRDVWSVMT
jgi:hypothetical protein